MEEEIKKDFSFLFFTELDLDCYLRCVQINLQHSKVASEELALPVIGDVALIQEPYIKNNRVRGLNTIRGYSLARKGRARAAIYVRKELETWLVEEFTDEDLCVCALEISGRTWYLASAYLDINLSIDEYQKLQSLVEFCSINSLPLVIGMDCNGHSSLWGCEEDNARGEAVEDFILMNGLEVHNIGAVPTFETIRARSIVDITLTNLTASRTELLGEWKVEEGVASHSDHKIISYTLGKAILTRKEVRNWKKFDGEEFRRQLRMEGLPKVGEGVEEAYTSFAGRVNAALDRCIPLQKLRMKTSKTWWNADLTKMQTELRELEAVRRRSEAHHFEYIERRRIYKKEIEKARCASWREFVSKTDSARATSDLLKILEADKQAKVSLLTHEGMTATNPSESLDMLLQSAFPGYREQETEAAVEQDRCEAEEYENFLTYIDTNKVWAAIRSFGPRKAAGPDGWLPLVLMNLTEEGVEYLMEIFKESYRTGVIPREWREMKVVFIPKVGKDTYSSPKSYRPITLSNFVLKVMERIIQWFLTERVVVLPFPGQHAYAAGRSTETALSVVVDSIEKMISRKKLLLAVSLDCSGAFDNISFDSARRAMLEKGIDVPIINWYDKVLRTRKVTADLQGVRKTIIPTRGSPQGGVLSPLIWIIIMDSLLRPLQKGPVKAVGYADDVLLMVEGVSAVEMGHLMQTTLNEVGEWAREQGLLFNPTKTQAMLCTRARKTTPKEPVLVMGGSRLQFFENIKYLGVLINRRLIWSHHLKERYKKCQSLMHKARMLIARDWGLTSERMLWVFSAIVQPKLTYAALVWSHNITATMAKKLQKLQRTALTMVLRPWKTVAAETMEVMMGLKPLNLLAKELATRARLRVRKFLPQVWDGVSDKGRREGHQSVLDKHLEECRLLPSTMDTITARRIWTPEETVPDPSLIVYTDGSRMSERTGYGLAITCGMQVIEEECGYLGDATVFQAEVHAIGRACLLLTKLNKFLGEDVLIMSDSQAAIMAIHSPKCTSATVAEAKDALMVARRCRRIGISWIRGHADFTGNELADHLAKAGGAQPSLHQLPVAAAEAKARIRRYWHNKWQEIWGRGTGCKHTRQFLAKVGAQGSAKKLTRNFNHKKLGLLTQVVSGHGPFGGHVGHWNEKIDPTCSLCEEGVETPWHLWSECPALELERREVIVEEKDLPARLATFFQSKKLCSLMRRRAKEGGKEEQQPTITT